MRGLKMPKTMKEKKDQIKDIIDSETFITISEGNKIRKSGKLYVSKKWQGYPCIVIVMDKV
jgi:hypothetical protein